MVTLLLDSDRLEVGLSATERALSFQRGNVIVPRSTIAKVMLTDDAWIWLRGVPSPGVSIPSVVAMGTWKSGTGLDLALIRRRRPSVVIDLDGHETFSRLLLTTRHGAALVTALQVEVESEPSDVAEIAEKAKARILRPRRKRPPEQASPE